MRSATLAIAFVNGVLLVGAPLVARSPEGAVRDSKAPDVVVTEADCGKTIRVKKGQVIEVRLLARMGWYWTQADPNPAFRSKLKYFKSEPAPRVGNAQVLNGTNICVNRYEVVSDADVPATLELMFCAPPSEAERLEGVGPKDPTADLAFWTRRKIERKQITKTEFRPGQFKEGMVFQVTVQTKSEPPKADQH